MNTLSLNFFLNLTLLFGILLGVNRCASIPEKPYKTYTYPIGKAFPGDVKRPYTTLGIVRSEINFPTLDPNKDEAVLCRNYFNQSVRELLKYTIEKGGDAVLDVKSVIFLGNGRQELHITPECSDEGDEGQILTQGIAVKWKTADEPLKKTQVLGTERR